MKASLFEVDAFTGEGLAGNRAAVCLLDHWIPDELLQTVASRVALSETAYVVQDVGGYDLRWFTPLTEVDLCGHATLASAYVVLTHLEPGRRAVTFRTRSGEVGVTRAGEMLVLDFPSRAPLPVDLPPGLAEAMGATPVETRATPRDWLLVYEGVKRVRALRPDMDALRPLDRPGVIATARGETCDFVSRFFAPGLGVDEDPVTGSAHCALTPYWAEQLGKNSLHAIQVSSRGGELFCEDRGDRVHIGGRVEPFLEGAIQL